MILTMTIPYNYSLWRLVSLVTFENTGTSCLLLFVRLVVVVTQPSTMHRSGNAFQVTFQLFWPVWANIINYHIITYYNSSMKNKDQHSY